MRFILATLVAKIVRKSVRLAGRGQGSSLPGEIALRIEPRYLKLAAQQITRIVLIAGTNGKTTTARVLTSALRVSGQRVVANAEGANMPGGVAAALAARINLFGKLCADTAVIECDEDALPSIAAALTPHILVLTNLFRDQLDRYGEVDAIAKRWQQVIKKLPKKSILVANANDPRLVQLCSQAPAEVVYFGVDSAQILGTPNLTAADAVRCPECGGDLGGSRFMAHLGVLRCQNCKFATPEPDVIVKNYVPKGFESSRVGLVVQGEHLELETSLIGRFNALNIAAAATAAQALHLPRKFFIQGAKTAARAFGRGEHLLINGRQVFLSLAKNPTGYNEVLRAIHDVDQAPFLLLALNDNWADGQDVSWIWDVDFEAVAPLAKQIATSGLRAGDLAVRLEVAGVTREIQVLPQLRPALDDVLQKKNKDPLHIIASYTAMLELRKIMADQGLVTQWHS